MVFFAQLFDWIRPSMFAMIDPDPVIEVDSVIFGKSKLGQLQIFLQ